MEEVGGLEGIRGDCAVEWGGSAVSTGFEPVLTLSKRVAHHKVYAYHDTFKKFKNFIIYFFIFKEDNKIFK